MPGHITIPGLLIQDSVPLYDYRDKWVVVSRLSYLDFKPNRDSHQSGGFDRHIPTRNNSAE